MSHGFSTINAAEMAAMTAAGANVIRMTVEQYHSMIGHTILEGAPIELLDGILVLKDRSKTGESPMTIYPPHAKSVHKIARLLLRLSPLGYDMRSQQPVTMPPLNEPEPDGSLVVGDADRYTRAHPGPGDVSCLFEVADASLKHDRTTKLRIYSRNGVPQYVIVNLIDDVVEFHSDVDAATESYRSTGVVRRGERFSIRLPDGSPFEIAADELLP